MRDNEELEKKYNKQIDGQKLLLDVFRLLENIELESTAKINTVLKYICTFSDFDRVHIALFSKDEKEFVYADEWLKPGVKLNGYMIEHLI